MDQEAPEFGPIATASLTLSKASVLTYPNKVTWYVAGQQPNHHSIKHNSAMSSVIMEGLVEDLP